MKKLFLLAVLIVAGMAASAQTVLYMQKGQTFLRYEGDITITNTTPVTVTIYAQVDWPTTQHFIIDVDSTATGNHTAVAATLAGANFTGQTFAAITTTVVDQGVNSNIDITGTNTTETRWRIFKITLTGTGTGVSIVDWLEFKLYNPD